MELEPLVNHILLTEKPQPFENSDTVKKIGVIELTKGVKYPEWINKAMFVDKAYGNQERKFFLVFYRSKSPNPNHFIMQQGCLIGNDFYATFRGPVNKVPKRKENYTLNSIIRELSPNHKVIWC